MDLFEQKQIQPMLIANKNSPPFNSDEFIYELKLDGIRCIFYIEKNGVEIRNKRNKNVTALYPEVGGIYRNIKKRCILDGELFVMRGGRPYFQEMERRATMTNPFKIELAAKKLPVSFVAYDIVYLDHEQINEYPLMERKKQLEKVIKTESERFALSRYIQTNGIDLFNSAQQRTLEGIVAKKMDSKYRFGIETKDWIKCKAMMDDDFIVCGYFNKNERFQIILGMYNNKRLIYKGHVVVGRNRPDYTTIIYAETLSYKEYTGFPQFDGAVWLKPELVCIVEFMEYTSNEMLRQPVYKSLRDDKEPKDCKM